MADVLVVGGGSNGLVAAVLAAQAGRTVTLLEQADHLGGASVSAQVFAGQPARLSRYAYLISLFPDELAARLGIRLRLASRPLSSYTPVVRAGRPTGLLVERRPGPATEDSFREITGSVADYDAWGEFYGELQALAAVVAPILTGPLRRRSEVRAAVLAAAGARIWADVVEEPIGAAIARRFRDDTVRGVVATDALIGTFTSLFDPGLLANRCFFYHVVGRGTGEWLVPVGGMGAVTDALVERARALGVRLLTSTSVTAAAEDESGVELSCTGPDGDRRHRAAVVLAAVAPAVVQKWCAASHLASQPAPVGAQLKVNLLLNRLPRLASGVPPATAFAGTTHLAEGFDQLESGFRRAASGELPSPLPAEVYCHSVTDPSILGAADPAHAAATLTLFGLHTPGTLFTADPERRRQDALALALASLQAALAEPLARTASPATPTADRASTSRHRWTLNARWACRAGTSSTATSVGPGWTTTNPPTPPAGPTASTSPAVSGSCWPALAAGVAVGYPDWAVPPRWTGCSPPGGESPPQLV